MLHTSLDSALITEVVAQLSEVDTGTQSGDAGGRQPVHTCYVPADKVRGDVPAQWGAAALAAMDEHVAGPWALSEVLGLPGDLVETVYEKVRDKLAHEPVEDLRIDFEDGYGTRSDDIEDEDATRCAELVAGWSSVPPWLGIRFKSFDTPALLRRGVRTLDVFVTTLAERSGLPDGFVLTFPKVTAVEQVSVLCDLLETIEERLGLATGRLRFEIQVETTRSIVDSAGRIAIPRFITAGNGRVSGLHFGTYDYTAACGLTAAEQHLAHGACDFARHVMQVSAAGTGVRLSDGSTNVLPVGDRDNVHLGWRTHYDLVHRSLAHGYFQGWDLHPAQLVTRYAATYAFYLAGAEADGRRLRSYMDSTGKVGGIDSIADEPATAQALAMSLRRALDCGAISAADLADLCGLSEVDLDALVRRE